jgi:hypothetical protein
MYKRIFDVDEIDDDMGKLKHVSENGYIPHG